MGEVKSEKPYVTLFFGLLSAEQPLLEAAEAILVKEFSPVLRRSETIPFDQTAYYEAEMGAKLLRRWIALELPVSPDTLPMIKNHTNRMEKIWAVSRDGKTARRVNIDPGYLDLARVCLATTKDRDHRLYIGSGIFGEVTIRYRKDSGKYEGLPWTYADYLTPAAQEFFVGVREGHRARVEQFRSHHGL